MIAALFAGPTTMFDRMRRGGPNGLSRPDVLLFTDDLSAGAPRGRGVLWKTYHERLFDAWTDWRLTAAR